MNVMYATDDGYVEIMAVSIKSLLENNKWADITIYIVVDSVSNDNITKLCNMIEESGAKVVFIEKPDIRNIIGTELKTLRWSDSAYSRLFLKLIFEKKYPSINKLLYIDCDTLITDSLEELWYTDVENYLGAACLECMSNMHKRIVGAKPKDNYINTGMILFNVDAWKRENIDTVMTKFIQKHKGKTEYVDQGVINGTISDRFLIINPRYNMTCLAYDFSYDEMIIYRKPSFSYSKEVWTSAINKPAIVHFTTSFLSVRPWFKESNHPYAGKWKELHLHTPWGENNYRVLNNSFWKRTVINVYRKIPSFIAIRFVGVFHSYIKPILFVLR